MYKQGKLMIVSGRQLSILFFCFSTSAYADCNDSFSVTSNSITISWDYGTCKNIKNSGDVFRVCWHKQGTIGVLCNSGNFNSSSKSGSMTINGLSLSTSYRVKTQYKRAYWDEVSERYIQTNANVSSTSPYLNVSGPQGNCRTFTWGGVPPIAPLFVRDLHFKHRTSKFGIFVSGDINNVSSLAPNSNGEYSFQKCGFKAGRANKITIREKQQGSISDTELATEVLFW
jgi:hypothetical protein